MTKDKKGNTGVENTGENNSGDCNSGDCNSGNRNSGYGNSGYGNSGDLNSGYGNSGYGNSGYGNSGYGNSGDLNSGYGNSGDLNSGYGNSTNRESGIFNSQKGKIRMFNKETNLTWGEIKHPHFKEFYLNKWIEESEMTDEEKKADPEFYVRGGYLKTFTWTEAWANFWKDTDEENRQKFLNLPNFDSEVFKEITGIDTGKKEVSLSGKEVSVTLDGKIYTAVIK
jgi:PPE-repeat protein